MIIKKILVFSFLITFFAQSNELILQNGLNGYEGCIDASNSSVMKTWNNGTGKEIYSFNCSN